MIRASYTLNKILTALARQHATAARLTDDDLVGHDLSAAERAAPGSTRRDRTDAGGIDSAMEALCRFASSVTPS